MSTWFDRNSFTWKSACIKQTYVTMLSMVVEQDNENLSVSNFDITNYHLNAPDCAYGLISKYWIWRQA
jgi:hypothetical protein